MMVQRFAAIGIVALVPAVSLGSPPDSEKALRKLSECMNPEPRWMCQYDYMRPCQDALRLGLSPIQASQAYHIVGVRALAMARTPAGCQFCRSPLERANCEASRIQEDVALINLREALRLNPGHLAARSELAHFFADRGNVAESYRLAKEGVRLRSDSAEAYRLLGYVCLRLKRWDDALNAYREAARLDPGQYLETFGEVASSLGLSEEALHAYREALRLTPSSPRLHARLAELHERRNDIREAVKEFGIVLDLAPDFLQKPENRRFAEAYERILSRPSSDRTPPRERPVTTGSGFFVTTAGHLVTNAHVVSGATRVWVRTVTDLLEANVVSVDSGNDVAVLKVEGKHSALAIASYHPQVGASVLAAGIPNPALQGLAVKVTRGEVNSLTGARDDPRHLQVSAAIQPGSSGGPLVDLRGNVVGVIVARLDEGTALGISGGLPQNVNYAIKASYVLALLDSIRDISAVLAPASRRRRSPEEVAAIVEQATVLVIAETG